MHGILFLICISQVLTEIRSDHWNEWSSWSECSRTCGGGATYQERKCLRSSRSKEGCEGERFKYNTCNNEPCSQEAQDFRAQQCAAYNNATYGGSLYTWLPYTDRKSPCTLYCIPKGTRTVVRLAPKVLDGTRCKFNAFDMCISGKCWPVGCDHKLDSPLTQDLCGVCGGNNSCLNNGTKERYHWVDIGLTPCSASCGVGVQHYQYRCRDRLSGNQVPEGRCAKSQKPSEKEKTCFKRQCPPVWKIFPWQACSVNCGGGSATRAVRCMDTLPDGRQHWLHDSFCPQPKPSTVRPCNPRMCPRWYAGEWSPCSVTCGWGEQVREVLCRHEGDMFCDLNAQPVTRRNCTTIFSCTDPDDPRLVAEHDDYAGQQELSFGISHVKADIVVDATETKHLDLPKYIVSDWSPCSATCGISVRTRYVRCQVQLQYLKQMVDLPDAECTEPKPNLSEPCNLEPCFKDFKWIPQGLTPCSRSCLGGTQETHLVCVHKISNLTQPDENCIHAEKFPIERKVCNEIPCPQRWRIGGFGECSRSCGGGLMNREVKCIQQIDVSLDRVLNLPDLMCEQPAPPTSRDCNTQPCPANWAFGHWSQCSVSCGVGIELRPVVCQRITQDGDPLDVDEYHCPPTERPEAERICNMSACPELKIKELQMKFFQMNPMDKVRLFVGGEASILPGTSVLILCPVNGKDKKKIEWLKNGKPVRPNAQIAISKRGNLRIKKVWPRTDDGKYTCVIGNKKSSIKMTIIEFMHAMQETFLREQYLRGYMNNDSASHVDPYDKKVRPLQVLVSEWSPCSTTCGHGVKKRKISCELIAEDYFEVFPLKVCKKYGIQIPTVMEKCNFKPCTKWAADEWSQCLNDKCLKKDYSYKVRTVKCFNEMNSSIVHDKYCHKASKPPTQKECKNPACQPVWYTSEWTECLANCGESGYQTRMLMCVWAGGELPAGRNCEGLARPVLLRPCFNHCTHGMWTSQLKPKPLECVDESNYCKIVPVMKLCRFKNFQTKCCHSCSSKAQDPPS
ncbi:ADAMTS-like protein 3 isoform X1 [Biomphalaria glabrata]|uniref:ADAMTS-like protein 3 isoform X1 n=1 Tax=Biomphalaria glabrata TaxID=6526 RepID=A0A9W3B512_BIOGL|nr:ADAMTS-like protein 3 isoform X1 [Biomphalaria glabrata]XP_013096567.2 ADAMTS-like protein 3 isoform X1 [Biomphalaria glabrata]XP_055894506.1 ADAMTS-like protein 3 isoform X1 [Biomphalaria glabrata]